MDHAMLAAQSTPSHPASHLHVPCSHIPLAHAAHRSDPIARSAPPRLSPPPPPPRLPPPPPRPDDSSYHYTGPYTAFPFQLPSSFLEVLLVTYSHPLQLNWCRWSVKTHVITKHNSNVYDYAWKAI